MSGCEDVSCEVLDLMSEAFGFDVNEAVTQTMVSMASVRHLGMKDADHADQQG